MKACRDQWAICRCAHMYLGKERWTEKKRETEAGKGRDAHQVDRGRLVEGSLHSCLSPGALDLLRHCSKRAL